MSNAEKIKKEISVARRELKNIRQEMMKIKALFKSELEEVQKLLFVNHHQKMQKETLNISLPHSEVYIKGKYCDSIKNQISYIDENKFFGVFNITEYELFTFGVVHLCWSDAYLDQDAMCFSMVPIGTISSCFKNKNGIPRQASLCQSAKATLEINKTFFTNPEHSLIGLEEFSYIWVLFVFHKNDPESSVKSKVHPPRLNGASVGVFSTRSPHRPCAIGLSLIQLDKILGSKLYLSGVDLLDGTPVLDIKPYIDSYDIPKQYGNVANADIKGSFTPERSLEEYEDFDSNLKQSSELIFSDADEMEKTKSSEDECSQKNLPATNKRSSKKLFKNVLSQKPEAKLLIASNTNLESSKEDNSSKLTTSVGYLLNKPLNQLKVIFTTRAETDIEKFHSLNHTSSCEYCLDFIDGDLEAKKAIVEILKNDPRSVYRRNKCSDKLYFFEVDTMHVTCWFEDITAEILRVKPVSNARDSCPG